MKYQNAQSWIRTCVLVQDQAHNMLISKSDQIQIGYLSRNCPEEILEGEVDPNEPIETLSSQYTSQEVISLETRIVVMRKIKKI